MYIFQWILGEIKRREDVREGVYEEVIYSLDIHCKKQIPNTIIIGVPARTRKY